MFFRSKALPVPTTLDCHFCLSPTTFAAGAVPSRPSASSPRTSARVSQQQHQQAHFGQRGFRWLCDRCSCWNGWDQYGETISDHAAMHSEADNSSSFRKRGTTPSTSFPTPTKTAKSPFCTSCTTNHSLIINLMASYLPNECDPSYPEALARLPEYKASVLERYPPLCVKCEPVAEEAIAKGDYRAKTSALNGFLNRSTVARDPQPGVVPPRSPLLVRIANYHVPTGIYWISASLLHIYLLAYTLYFSRFPITSPSTWPHPGGLIGADVMLKFLTGWDPLANVAAKRPAGWLRRQRLIRKRQMGCLYILRLISVLVMDLSRADWLRASCSESTLVFKTYAGLHLALELVVILTLLFTTLFPPPPPLRPIRLTRTPNPPSITSTPTNVPSPSHTPAHPPSHHPKPPPTFTSSHPTTLDTFGRPHHPLFGAAPTWPSSTAPPTTSTSTSFIPDVEMEDVSRPPPPFGSSRPAGLDDGEGEDETWKLFNRAPTVFGPGEPTGLERLVEGWGLGEGVFGSGSQVGSGGLGGEEEKEKGWLGFGGWFGGKQEKRG